MEVKQRLDKVISSVRTIQEDLAFERAIERTTEYLADLWLNSFGAVERERILTGDETAVPKPDSYMEGGRRGNPGDIADILMLHADVESVLKGYSDPMRELLVFLHGACLKDVTSKIIFHFADGSGSVECPIHSCGPDCPSPCPNVGLPENPPLPEKIGKIEDVTERRIVVDWSKFGTDELEKWLDRWGCVYPEFLIWRYLRFRCKLIKAKGLDKMARERVADGTAASIDYRPHSEIFEKSADTFRCA